MAKGLVPTSVNLVGRHNGGAGDAISFCQQTQGITAPPAAWGTPFGLRFPSPSALATRARAWVNTLATPLVVTLFKNGVPALRSDGVTPVTLTIPAGSIEQIFNTTDVVDYSDRDTYDVRLSSTAAGAGNSALVGVAIETLPDGRRYSAPIINMTSQHNGAGGTSTSFAKQGDVTTPAQPYGPSDLPFPGRTMAFLRARAWTNNLAQGILVRPFKNGAPAMSRTPLTITNVTNASPAVVTTFEDHGFLSGNLVVIEDVEGVDVNGEWFVFVPPSSLKTFELQGSNTVLPLIINASNTTPISITTATPHGLIDGQTITITGVTGNTAANGTFTIFVTSTLTFNLIGSVGNGAYIAGGAITGSYIPGTGFAIPQMALFIPAGSTDEVIQEKEVAVYEDGDEDTDDESTYDVRLTSDGGGGGNSALVAVSFNVS